MQRSAKLKLAAGIIRRAFRTPPRVGYCPICGHSSVFVAFGPWLREDLKCVRCRSSSRQRALIHYISDAFPALADLRVYEPSPTQPTKRWLACKSRSYAWSRYAAEAAVHAPNDPPNQDLRALSFPSDSFDLVVSQDVFEHVAEPRIAFSEVARVLAPGGSHVFTIPFHPDCPTRSMAKMIDGEWTHLHPPEYHNNPDCGIGALVVTRFGIDLQTIISQCSGMSTSVLEFGDPGQAIMGDSLFVFHSKKPRASSTNRANQA
jgi:SAM-dependent methyltransferase